MHGNADTASERDSRRAEEVDSVLWAQGTGCGRGASGQWAPTLFDRNIHTCSASISSKRALLCGSLSELTSWSVTERQPPPHRRQQAPPPALRRRQRRRRREAAPAAGQSAARGGLRARGLPLRAAPEWRQQQQEGPQQEGRQPLLVGVPPNPLPLPPAQHLRGAAEAAGQQGTTR